MSSSSYKKYNELGADPASETQRPMQQQPMQMQQRPMQMQQPPMQMQQPPMQMQQPSMQMQRPPMQMQQQPMQMQQPPMQMQQRPANNSNLVNIPPKERLEKACHKCTSIPQKKNMIWNNEICVFKVGAPWCAPCREIAPRYYALAFSVSSPGKVLFAEEELDDNLSANVRGVPCFDFYFRGKKVHRQNGGNFKELQNNVRRLILQAKNTPYQEVHDTSTRGDPSSNLGIKMSQPPHPADGMQPRNRVKIPQRGEIPATAIRKFV